MKGFTLSRKIDQLMFFLLLIANEPALLKSFNIVLLLVFPFMFARVKGSIPKSIWTAKSKN